MTLLLLALVTMASAIIVAVVVWGAHNGALRESDQEGFDRRFHRIVIADRYARDPRLP